MKYLFFFLLFLSSTTLYAQPLIDWQKSYGGLGEDKIAATHVNPDGSIVLVGTTTSSTGDVVGQHGNSDMWVLKTDASGLMLWQKTLGGTGADGATDVKGTGDGGYIVVGFSTTADGDVSGNLGLKDMWVVKLDANGTKVWDKNYGKSKNDIAHAVAVSPDGGFVVGGGMTDPVYNDLDFTVVKFADNGDIVWIKFWGAETDEEAHSITISNDGQYIVGGYMCYDDTTLGGCQYAVSEWIMKIDINGNRIWVKDFDNSHAGRYYKINHIITTSDGGLIYVGSASYRQFTNNYDIIIQKMSATGLPLWSNQIGGTGADYGHKIRATSDGGYLVIGQSFSVDGNATQNNGFGDAWLIKLRSDGSIKWQKNFGGTGADAGMDIRVVSNGDYLVVGNAQSNDGDVTTNKGGTDFWLFRTKDNPAVENEVENLPEHSGLKVFPNPFQQTLNIQTENTVPFDITIFNVLGQEVYRAKNILQSITWKPNGLPGGIYFYQLKQKQELKTGFINYIH